MSEWTLSEGSLDLSGLDKTTKPTDLIRPIGPEFGKDVTGIDEAERSGGANRRAVATPGPFFRPVDNARANRVPGYIPERLKNRLGIVLPSRPVPTAYEVADPQMSLVEELRVSTHKSVHAGRQRIVRQFKDRVPVRREQAEGDAPPRIAIDGRCEELKPRRAIAVVNEVQACSGCTYANVLNSWREIAGSSRHASSFRERS